MTRIARRLIPTTLAGRTTIVLVASLLLLHLGSIWVHEASLRHSSASVERALEQDLTRAVLMLGALQASERDAAVHHLSTSGLAMHWRAEAQPDAAGGPGHSDLADLRGRLARLPGLGAIHLDWGDPERNTLVGSVPLPEGGMLSFATPVTGLVHGVISDKAAVVSLAVVAAAVGIVSVLVVRVVTRPLRSLARAADRIGNGAAPVYMPVDGPVEVRDAARAFNAMQERIQHLQEDRVQALAAVGHDLRTPLARLRLRAGFLDDAGVRGGMDADLDDMERMVTGVLDYLRDGRDSESPKAIDLVAMIYTLCDAATDAGAEVDVRAPDRLVLSVKQTAVRRALGNLFDNGLTHGGGSLSVVVQPHGGGALVEIADRGPGIPDAELDRVFEPFVRLDESRNRSTGGVGLGLAIARRAIETAGGTLCLANRSGGGLTATVVLARSKDELAFRRLA